MTWLLQIMREMKLQVFRVLAFHIGDHGFDYRGDPPPPPNNFFTHEDSISFHTLFLSFFLVQTITINIYYL
jgi:hypothetical protein